MSRELFLEMAEFAGKVCGTIAKDLADISKPLAEAFRRGWQAATPERPTTEPAPPSSNHAAESA